MQHVLSTHLFVAHRLTTVWLDRVWDAGFPAVEIFCARQHIDYRDKAQITELGHWFRDAELQVHSLHAPMYTDDVWGRSGPHAVIDITDTTKARRMAAVDEIKRALEIAEIVPFRYLIQHVGVTGQEFDEWRIESAFSSLDELRVFAGQRGVELLLENTPNQLSSAQRLNQLLTITHLNLNYCFDLGHAHMSEGVAAEFELMKDRIRSTHVHDNNGHDDQHLFPGQGSIDWKETMRLLGGGSGQYPLLLELKEVPTLEHPLQEAKQSVDQLTKYLTETVYE
ncbi:MAG: sugar phosphate isomerase/epimerase [Acidobacteriaceae bacterium]|nr:sugar phosphate isomerase/epimerase [Acidobacteriaceae bacterium]